MDIQQEDDLLAMALEAASAASAILRDMQASVQNQAATTKESHRSIVTAADVASETEILRMLQAGPESTIVSEERFPGVPPNSGLCWIVDPLDGTSAYFHGLDSYSVSIAAWWHRRPLLGVVAVPALEEVAHAITGRGAYAATGALKVSYRERSTAIVSMSASLVRSVVAGSWGHQDEIRDAIIDAQGLRIADSCAHELLLVAQGKVDVFLATRQPLWDYAAGALLVREAGGHAWVEVNSADRKNILVCNSRTDFFSSLTEEMVNYG